MSRDMQKHVTGHFYFNTGTDNYDPSHYSIKSDTYD